MMLIDSGFSKVCTCTIIEAHGMVNLTALAMSTWCHPNELKKETFKILVFIVIIDLSTCTDHNQ